MALSGTAPLHLGFGKAQKAVVLLGYQINHIAVPFDMAVADFTLGLDQVLNGLFLGVCFV